MGRLRPYLTVPVRRVGETLRHEWRNSRAERYPALAGGIRCRHGTIGAVLKKGDQMDTFLLRVHQQQIVHQCHAALQGAEQADAGLKANNQETFWAGIQNLLTASANIAKACWGAGGKLAQQRQPLRESLGVADDSPLAVTDLRNHLEHYDERLDHWFATSARRNHVDFIIGPAEGTIGGVDDTDIFRHFDPASGHVIFWGEHYPMRELATAIQELLPIASAEAKNPHWDGPSSAGTTK